MVKIEEVIIVEGKYDKNTLSQVVDAVILETSGFGIFHDKERRKLFQKLAEQRGLIILTDSDGAGFVIRNYLKGFLPPEKVKQAYVPDLYGKEKRKASPSKEGKLGVEGMRPEILLEALGPGPISSERSWRARPLSGSARPIFIAWDSAEEMTVGQSVLLCSGSWSFRSVSAATPCWTYSTP